MSLHRLLEYITILCSVSDKQNTVFKVHLCYDMHQPQVLFFYDGIIFHYVYIPEFIHLILIDTFAHCEQCIMNMHMCVCSVLQPPRGISCFI